MIQRNIPKKIRNKRLRESVAASKTAYSASESGGGSGGGGLPYSLNDAGEYVIDNTTNFEGEVRATKGVFSGDVVAHKTGALLFAAVDGTGASQLNDLTDVTILNPKEGDILRFDGQYWRNISEVIINAGTYKI